MTGMFGWLGTLSALTGGSVARLVVTTLIFGTAVATVVTGATGAIFTDNQSVGANTFSTGTVLISASPTSAVVSLSGMAPGDKASNRVTGTPTEVKVHF